MSQTELVEDYSLKPVPDADTMPGWKIATVIFAIGFTLPLFALGTQIAQGQGLSRATLAYFLGCLLVGLVSLATSVIGGRTRISTYMLLTLTFGRTGGRAINVLLGLTLIGWFANVADLLGIAISETLRDVYAVSISPFACTGTALVFMTMTAIFGFRIMERFASVVVPILCAFMIYLVVLALGRGSLWQAARVPGDGSLSFSDSVSAVFGAVVLTAVLAPDFTRYARSDRAAMISVLGLAIGYPLVMLIAAIPASILGEPDVMKFMAVLGVPGVAITLLVLSTWTSNTGNLYSGILTLATVLPRVPTWQIGIAGSLVALIASYFHVSTQFVPFLVLLGVTAMPIAGVYVTEFYLLRRSHIPVDALRDLPALRPRTLAAWGAGVIVGYVGTRTGGLATPMPALEAFVASVVLYLLLHAKEVGAAWRAQKGFVARGDQP